MKGTGSMIKTKVAGANATKGNIKEMTITAMMVTIIVVMSMTPLGYFRTLGLSISLLGIPVSIGAMVLGAKIGAILGLTFGLTSFYQCVIGGTPFGAMIFSINPFYAFLVCVPTRTLMGFLTGYIFQVLHKLFRNQKFPYYVGGAMAALLNTIFFMSMLLLLYWNTEYIQGFNENFGGLSPIGFVFAFVGINGLLELPATCVAGGAISERLKKVFSTR